MASDDERAKLIGTMFLVPGTCLIELGIRGSAFSLRPVLAYRPKSTGEKAPSLLGAGLLAAADQDGDRRQLAVGGHPARLQAVEYVSTAVCA